MTERCTPTGSSVDILGRPRSERRISGAGDGGYAMAALLVSLVTMGVMMSMALPVWSQAAKREREAELVFRGEQYARAVALYQRRFAGAYPPDVDSLVEQRFLRRRYKDPMMDDGQFQVIYQTQAARIGGAAATAPRPGQATGQPSVIGSPAAGQRNTTGPRGGVIGVVSRSTDTSLRIYYGGTKYSEWAFVYLPSSTQPGTVAPGAPGGATRQPQPGQRPHGVVGSGDRSGGRNQTPGGSGPSTFSPSLLTPPPDW